MKCDRGDPRRFFDGGNRRGGKESTDAGDGHPYQPRLGASSHIFEPFGGNVQGEALGDQDIGTTAYGEVLQYGGSTSADVRSVLILASSERACSPASCAPQGAPYGTVMVFGHGGLITTIRCACASPAARFASVVTVESESTVSARL